MTGFASSQGIGHDVTWSWDLRAVNGRGLDVRLRVPEFVDGLERAARASLQKAVARGNVTLGLRLSGEDAGASIAQPDPERIDAALEALRTVQDRATALGVDLAPASGVDILSIKGVMEAGSQDRDIKPLAATLIGELPALIESFNAARATEGAALAAIITQQLAGIETHVAASRALLPGRAAAQEAALRSALERVGAVAEGVDDARIAQELAIVAVKSDVAEELDRLDAHVAGARALLAQGGPIGRKLDFLCQEFNREANTLCSKSTDPALTAVGLDLKALIDQMREQVQNLE